MSGKQKVTDGWESVHQRLKKQQLEDENRWRLRDWDAHPNDPEWENGRYSTCHAEFRTKVQSGDVVFDTVHPGRAAGAPPIIRSAFIVEDASDGVLSFSEFVFLDGEASDGVQARVTRGHKSLNKGQVEEYMQQINARDAYTRYSTGSKPKSIPQDLWEKMLKKAGTDSGCPSCHDEC